MTESDWIKRIECVEGFMGRGAVAKFEDENEKEDEDEGRECGSHPLSGKYGGSARRIIRHGTGIWQIFKSV